MKVVVFHEKGPVDVLRVEEIATPTPAADQVLIRVEAAGVNYGDVLRRSGRHYPLPTPLPHIPGVEVVGIVEEVGSDVDRPVIGKRVCWFGAEGGYAEYVVASAKMVFVVPGGLDPVTAVAIFVHGLTAALILKEARVSASDTVLIPAAAGGVGSLALQLAVLAGAKKVFGGASSPDKRRVIEELGGEPINYTQPSWEKELVLRSEGGVDLALEMSGGSVFAATLAALRFRGRMVIFGNASDVRVTIKPEDLLRKSLTVKGWFLPPFLGDAQLINETLANLASHIKGGRLKPRIGGLYPLSKAGEAHTAIENRTSVGKLIIEPFAM